MAEYCRYALTLGEQSEIRVGCEIHGDGLAESGFTLKELQEVVARYPEVSRLTRFDETLPRDERSGNRAGLLVIRRGVNLLMKDDTYADRMLEEQEGVRYDRKYFDNRRKRTLHNIARYNTVFGEESRPHSKDYRECTVIGYDEVPLFQALRKRLPRILGDKARQLNAEGNHYYREKSGVGFHGDAERKIVICCSLGNSATLRFHWREPGSSACYGEPYDFRIRHGDIYVMSEKASGYDWRKRSLYRLVHAAGSDQYIRIKDTGDS